jgi:hypothetical protein
LFEIYKGPNPLDRGYKGKQINNEYCPHTRLNIFSLKVKEIQITGVNYQRNFLDNFTFKD